MSYFDFFCKNIRNDQTDNQEQIRGTCNSMCPQTEIDLRVRENLVHVLEVVGGARRLVKSYSRSAADSNMAVPHLLRPHSVLKQTVHYLLFEVTKRTDVSSPVLYDFVDDRLRAVRQDMTIQRLAPRECAALLEPMIRFYVYFGYKLGDLPLSDYDPVLNKKYMLECLKWFLYCCDTLEQTNREKVNELADLISKMDIKKNSLDFDRPLMESIYILSNLHDFHPLLRYLSLQKELKGNQSLCLAYTIALENFKGNYIKVCRLTDKLCPLSYYALWSHLPSIQRRAVQVMSHAYSSKTLSVPSRVLQQWLHLATSREALAISRHYGLKAEGDQVRFNKADFNADVSMHQVQKKSLDEKWTNIDYIFTYPTNKRETNE